MENDFVFDITYNLYFSINLILRTTRNARIPTMQSTVPVPLRRLTSDCMVLIRYGQYPSIARTIYGHTRIRVWCSALMTTVVHSCTLRNILNFALPLSLRPTCPCCPLVIYEVGM